MQKQTKTVAIIPPRVQYDREVHIEEKPLRVAAYCRVSTLLEQQEGSYEAQVDYYTQKIMSNPNWRCAGIFADEGKSATGTKKRDDFNAMMAACLDGKIDLVLTKSVSRFSRNTIDTLNCIRALKERNIPVIFENQGINTMSSEGELIITFLASQAQEESRNISENTRWGLTRRFENGQISLNHTKFMGYTKDEHGNLVVVEEQAKIVRRIFREYLEGRSSIQICRSLEADGIKTVTGLDKWNSTTIDQMLSQEKYCGDVCMQKTYTTDFLTKKKVKNEGYVKKYYIEDNHEAIIPKELYHQVQAEKIRRANLHKSAVTRKKNMTEKQKSKYSSKYVLTDLLVCAQCGHAYRRQVWSKYGVKTPVWRCEDRLKLGSKSRCTKSPTINEKELHQTIMTIINNVVENSGEFISVFRNNVLQVIEGHIGTRDYEAEIESLQKQMLQSIEDNVKNGAISESIDEEYKLIAQQIAQLRAEQVSNNQANQQAKTFTQHIDALDTALDKMNPNLWEFDQELVRRLIQKIGVRANGTVEVQFYSGIVVEG